MPGKLKMLLSLLVVIITLNLAACWFSRTLLLDDYLMLEREEMREHILQVLHEIGERLHSLSVLTKDYSSWDDSYRFLLGEEPDYPRDNLTDEILRSLELTLVACFDRQGDLIFGRLLDQDRPQATPLPEPVLRQLGQLIPQYDASFNAAGREGLLPGGSAPLLMVALPVLTTLGDRPAAGMLVFGRALDQAALTSHSETAHVAMAVSTSLGDTVVPLFPGTLAEKVVKIDYQLDTSDRDQVVGRLRLPDVFGESDMLLTATQLRTIYQQGVHTIGIFQTSFAAASLIAGLLLWLLLNRLATVAKMAEVREFDYRRTSLELQAVLDALTSSLVLVSPEMELVWTNRVASEEFNFKLKGMNGKYKAGKYQLFPLEDEYPLLVDALASGDYQEAVIEKSGQRKFSVKVFPLRNDLGQLEGVIRMSSDITEKLLLRQEAEQAGRLASLGELSAGIAHEINNPVGIMQMNLPLVKEVMLDLIAQASEGQKADASFGDLSLERVKEEVPYLIDEMILGAQRIKTIVQDLKNFARSELEEEFTFISLNDVVEVALRLTANPLRKATDNFSVNCQHELPLVQGDARKLEQIVVNLILNSCQALPDRQAAIRVRTYAKSGWVRVEVTDEGGGIEPEQLQHIKEPFFTTRRTEGGTGLGLSVSNRIAMDHGGQLRFSSTPGEGTVATLTLPAKVR
jgi:signal transduction histidine kinase